MFNEKACLYIWCFVIKPSYNSLINSNSPNSFKQALKEAIINFDYQTILDQLNYKGFLATDDSNYEKCYPILTWKKVVSL